MKKRIITISIIICFLATTSIVYAANTATVNAVISGLKMYFKGNQLNGDVLTAKGVTYVPMDILSNNLGFKLSSDSKTKKLTITEKVSKDKLSNDITSLQNTINALKAENSSLTTDKNILESDKSNLESDIEAFQTDNANLKNDKDELQSENKNLKNDKNTLQTENSSLKTQIDDLNTKLKLYRGDVPSDSEYIPVSPSFDTTTKINYLDSTAQAHSVHSTNWSSVLPFMINGKALDDKNVFGILFSSGQRYKSDNNYDSQDIYIDNSKLLYTKFKFYIALDDIAKNLTERGTSIVYYGNSSVYGTDMWLGLTILNIDSKHQVIQSQLKNGDIVSNGSVINNIAEIEVNIKGYEQVVIKVYHPCVDNDYGYRNYEKGYILFMNPQVK